MPRQAYIVDAVRTPTGRKKGGLAAIHAADLGAHVINALMQRTGIDPGAVEDVIFGACDQIGPLAGDVARTCWLAAGPAGRMCPAPRSTANAVPRSRRCISPPWES